MQRRHRGRAENDVTRSIDSMAAQDGRHHRRTGVLDQEWHALAVDLHVVERGAAVGGDVSVTLQERESRVGYVAAPRKPTGLRR